MPDKCLRCQAQLIETRENITEKVLGFTFEFNNIPVLKCVKCGEIHFSGPVNKFIEESISDDFRARARNRNRFLEDQAP